MSTAVVAGTVWFLIVVGMATWLIWRSLAQERERKRGSAVAVIEPSVPVSDSAAFPSRLQQRIEYLRIQAEAMRRCHDPKCVAMQRHPCHNLSCKEHFR